jgi:hypothetical protein
VRRGTAQWLPAQVPTAGVPLGKDFVAQVTLPFR